MNTFTYEQIKDQSGIIDASGIENPEQFTWFQQDGIFFPYEKIERIQTISIKMTWEGMLRTCLTLYTDGNAEARKMALEQMIKMARIADLYVKAVEENWIENGLKEKEVRHA